MDNIDTLGQFEAWILTAVLTLGPTQAYGMTIHEKVEELSKRPIVSLGAVYTALDRLEKKGMVSSWFGEKTAERGGRAKKFFKIEAAGMIALDNTVRQAAAMTVAWDAIRGTA